MSESVKVEITGHGVYNTDGVQFQIGDTAEFHSALANLLINSAKAKPAGDDAGEPVNNVKDQLVTNPEKNLDPNTGEANEEVNDANDSVPVSDNGDQANAKKPKAKAKK